MYNTQHVHKMFDLTFIQNIKFFFYPEHTSLYKLLTSNKFQINQDRKTALVVRRCEPIQYVKMRKLQLQSYLDEYASYFDLNRRIKMFDL